MCYIVQLPYLTYRVGDCMSRHPALRPQHGPNAQIMQLHSLMLPLAVLVNVVISDEMSFSVLYRVI